MKQLKLTALASMAAAVTLLFSCTKNDSSLSTGAQPSSQVELKVNKSGYLYTESNELDHNIIIAYEQHADGSLVVDSTYASGGNGTGEGLGSQGAIALNKEHTWLFAVNAGSNSVSAFKVDDEGHLQLMSTVNSNGLLPISVTSYGVFVYVVNSGSDNIAGFILGNDNQLTPIPNSIQPLSATASQPAEIKFKPDGKGLMVTEKATQTIALYLVDMTGLAGPGKFTRSKGKTPFGFDFQNSKNAVVSNAVNGVEGKSSATSYVIGGSSITISGPVQNGQTAACWCIVSKNSGVYAYVSNTGSDNISSYTISSNGLLNLQLPVAGTTHKTPLDITFSGGDQTYLYALASGAQSIDEFLRNPDGSLTSVGLQSGLPASAVGLVAFK